LKKALVTGATSGIGLALVKYLLDHEYYVYAVGRDFSRYNFESQNLETITCDLTDIDSIQKSLSHIKTLHLLINSAGFGIFTQHEDIKITDIDNMIDVNLKAPIILTKLFLKHLKITNGYIINITSIEATKSSKFSALYSATKSGLRAFGLALFEEVRKSGVKVVTINPDITKTNFFDNLTFKYSENEEAHLLVEDIIESVDYILNSRDSMVVTELTVRSQKFMIEKK
jgi:short-subunit dehydrogenase